MTTLYLTPDTRAAAPAFLELIPARLRGSVTNAFLGYGPRNNMTDTGAICAAVYAEFQQKRRRAQNPEDAAKYDAVLSAIGSQIDAALEYAEWAIYYHNMPEAERQERKREQADAAVQKWMAGQKPTNKQIAYLNQLGYIGAIPVDRAEACRLINGLLNGESRVAA